MRRRIKAIKCNTGKFVREKEDTKTNVTAFTRPNLSVNEGRKKVKENNGKQLAAILCPRVSQMNMYFM